MHARVTYVQSKPGKVDEAINIAKESIVPAAKAQKGFKGYLLLIDSNANKSITVSLWETEADMLAGESSDYYREQLAKVGPLLAGAPTTEHYEVAIQV